MNTRDIKRRKYSHYLSNGSGPKRKRLSKTNEDSDDEGAPSFPPELLPALLPNMGQKQESTKKIYRDGNHIYFRDKVNMETIGKLCKLVDDANTDYTEFSDHQCGYILPKPLYVHICTVGGDLFAGFMGYDYLKQSHIPVYTVSEGHTISAGSLMYMAGTKRFMSPTSYILIHQLRGGIHGTHAEIEDEFENCENLMDRMKKVYMGNLNTKIKNKKELLNDGDLESQMGRDIFWDFEMCYKKGLAHELYTNLQDRDLKDKEYLLNNLKELSSYLK